MMMKLQPLVTLVALSLCSSAGGVGAALSSRRKPRSPSSGTRALGFDSANNEGLYDLLLTTLREMLSGPMAGKTISFLVDAELKTLFNLDRLLATLEGPFYLLRSDTSGYAFDVDVQGYGGREDFGGGAEDLNNDTLNEVRIDEDGTDEETNEEFVESEVDLLLPKVLVGIIGGGKMPWMLTAPPLPWSPSAVLMVNLDEKCDSAAILQTRLLQQTPSAAVMCLERSRDPRIAKRPMSFHIFTWKPFHSTAKLVPLGRWSAAAFPDWMSLFPDRFVSLSGATLHVSSDDGDMPFFFRRPDGTFDGTSKRMMDALGEWMDFSFTLTRRASDKKWGEKVNGTWVGMLGDVWRGDKDLAINYFSVTLERVEDFDYSVSHYNEGFGFSIMIPPPLPRWVSLIYPFSFLVWAAVGGSLLVTAFTLYILSYSREEHLSPFQSFIFAVQSLMNQSIQKVPAPWLLRVFLAIWWITAYIIVISYTCNLIAVLTVPVYPKRIHTVQELAESNYRICMLDYGEFVPEALATSSDATLFALGSKLDLTPVLEIQYYGEEGCVEMVLEGDHAHVETYSFVKLLYSEMGHGDEVYFVKEQIYEANLAFFFKKNTPWKYKFDLGIRRLVEAGLVHKWYDDIMDGLRQQHSKEFSESESAEKPLTLAHLQGPFLIFAVGHLLSGLIFLFEYFSAKQQTDS